MKHGFCRLIPIILSMTGSAIIIFLFFVRDVFYTHWQWIIWMILLLVNVSSGVLTSIIIIRLHHEANKDSLTGLYNRRCFYNRINYEIEKIKSTKLPLSLVLIDIDNFKAINDTYGHLVGDKVLIELAGLLKTQTRSGDTIVRWGGEEFAIILPETNESGAFAFSERIRALVERSSTRYKTTICIGITTVYQEYDAEKIISIADRALYKAKENKNMVVLLAG